jgi:ketosteroid isomerase-like protein
MPGSGAKPSASEGEIRAIIDARLEAVRAKDVRAAMSYHQPDAVLFDVIEPLRYMGASAGKKRAEEWFSSFEGPLGYEIRELNVTAGDSVAFSYGLNHVKGTKMDGGELDMWWRATVCYQKIDGKWAITPEHGSVPFDATSGKASLHLKP